MAFSQPIPRPFSERGIRVYAPAAPGVFGLSNSRQWVHVGQTRNIRQALLDCLSQPDTPMGRYLPTGFVFEPCLPETQDHRRLQLIAEYNPICERRPHQLERSATL